MIAAFIILIINVRVCTSLTNDIIFSTSSPINATSMKKNWSSQRVPDEHDVDDLLVITHENETHKLKTSTLDLPFLSTTDSIKSSSESTPLNKTSSPATKTEENLSNELTKHFNPLWSHLPPRDDVVKELEKTRQTGGSLVTSPTAYPFVVSISTQWKGNATAVLCTGILMNNNSVLTTSTCLSRTDNLTVNIGNEIIVPSTNKTKVNRGPLIKRGVTVSYIDPLFSWNNGSTFDRDEHNRAWLLMDHPVYDYSDFVQRANLPDPNGNDTIESLITRNVTCYAVGFGDSLHHGSDAGTLRLVPVYIIRPNDCESYYNTSFKSDSHVCAMRRDGQNLCYYDEGAPLVCQNKVYGMFTSIEFVGYYCKKPIVFTLTSVKSLRDTFGLLLYQNDKRMLDDVFGYVESQSLQSETKSEMSRDQISEATSLTKFQDV